MKKIGVLGVVVSLMAMLVGCSGTTYTLKFDNVSKIVVVNKSTAKEADLSKEQITTATEDLGEITFEAVQEDLGDEYQYKLSMSNGTEEPVYLYIIDSTHMKMNDKFYVATENQFNLPFYMGLFK